MARSVWIFSPVANSGPLTEYQKNSSLLQANPENQINPDILTTYSDFRLGSQYRNSSIAL